MKRILLLLLLISVLASGCTSPDGGGANSSAVAESGDFVSVNYVGELENGTVFDTSIEQVAQDEGIYNPDRSYEPLGFVTGSGQMLPGFDEAVIGMSVGEEKTVEIPPEEAYGTKFITIPVEEFSNNNITPEVGEVIAVYGSPYRIVNVSGGSVNLENNHPLAGEKLIFTIELVSIGDAEENSSSIA